MKNKGCMERLCAGLVGGGSSGKWCGGAFDNGLGRMISELEELLLDAKSGVRGESWGFGYDLRSLDDPYADRRTGFYTYRNTYDPEEGELFPNLLGL